MSRATDDVPASLRTWFSVQFVVDLAVGVPLLAAPEAILPRLGWLAVDGVTARLLGAALVAMGVQSLRSRHAGRATCRAVLALTLVWSAAAILGMIIAIGTGAPGATWAILSGLVASSGVSAHHAIRLKQMDAGPGADDEPDNPLDSDPAAENDLTTEDLGPSAPVT
jgi:hypothetical protein